MKPLSVGILTTSKLLAEGVRSIIQQSIGKDTVCINLSAGSLEEQLASHDIKLIIADPLNSAVQRFICAKIENKEHSSIPIIALAASALDPDTAGLYDATLSIYDTPGAITQTILHHTALAENDENDSKNDLTPREKEILVGIVKGFSNKEIAAEINVSVNTVMTHRRNIASKLQIHSPAGLTIYAIVSKLVSIDEIKHSIN